jgi:hypothetical protein
MHITILKCSGCGTLMGGPRQLCPKCHGARLDPHQVEGAGKLLTWTVVRRPPQAFREEGAYAVAVVALDAGVPVTVRLARPEGSPEPPAGARVRMTSEHKGAAVFEST